MTYGITVVDTPGKAALASRHCMAAVVPVIWDRYMPDGKTINQVYLERVRQTVHTLARAGVQVHLEPQPQYPPQLVKNAVRKFKDQFGREWTSTDPGSDIRDWFSDPVGRTYLSAFMRSVLTEVGLLHSDVLRIGAGHYNEVSYPQVVTNGDKRPEALSYWSAGAPDAPPFGSKDNPKLPSPEFLEYHQKAIEDFLVWYIGDIRTCYEGEIRVCHPSWGVRDDGYAQDIAEGCSWERQIARYAAADDNTWAYSTWINGRAWGTSDSGRAPADWLKEVATRHGRGHRMAGENTEENLTIEELQYIIDVPVGQWGYDFFLFHWDALHGVSAAQFSAMMEGIRPT